MTTELAMTADLWILVWTLMLTLALVVVAALGSIIVMGVPTAAGNREGVAPFEGWVGRAERAHLNMLENLPLFIGLIIVAHLAGKVGDMTVLGAQIFFWARLVHAVVYILGIPWVRTLMWLVSIAGLVIIFVGLF